MPQFFHLSNYAIPKIKEMPLPASPLICAFSHPQPRVAACWFCTCSTPPRPLLHGLCMFHPSQPTLICRSSCSFVVFSVHLPSTTGGPQRCRRRKRAVGGVGVKGLFADDESDWGLRRHAQKSTAHTCTTKHCAHRLRPHHWLAGPVSPKYNRKNNRFRFRLTISFGPCPPRTPQTL